MSPVVNGFLDVIESEFVAHSNLSELSVRRDFTFDSPSSEARIIGIVNIKVVSWFVGRLECDYIPVLV